MIKVKNKELLNSNEIVSAVKELGKLAIPMEISCKAADIITSVENAINRINNRKEMITQKFIKRDDSGNPIFAKDNNGNEDRTRVELTDAEKYNNEMHDLEEQETDLDADPIKIKEFPSDIRIVPTIIKALRFAIKR